MVKLTVDADKFNHPPPPKPFPASFHIETNLLCTCMYTFMLKCDIFWIICEGCRGEWVTVEWKTSHTVLPIWTLVIAASCCSPLKLCSEARQWLDRDRTSMSQLFVTFLIDGLHFSRCLLSSWPSVSFRQRSVQTPGRAWKSKH